MSCNLRVGLIRCDPHAAFFGTLMVPHDPLRIQQPAPADQPMRCGWQKGTTRRYFYADPDDPTRLTAKPVDGFELVNLFKPTLYS